MKITIDINVKKAFEQARQYEIGHRIMHNDDCYPTAMSLANRTLDFLYLNACTAESDKDVFKLKEAYEKLNKKHVRRSQRKSKKQ